MNHLERKKFIKDYFNNATPERIAEMKDIVKKYEGCGVTVDEFLKQTKSNKHEKN